MKKKIVLILSSELVQVLAQIFLGSIFLYAGIAKLFDLKMFAEVIKNYKILSVPMAEIISISLPYIEIVCGSLLILNIYPRLMASILSGFLMIFIIAISINIIRGINIDCGCFNKFQVIEKKQISSSNMKITILRDIIFLIPGIVIIFSRPKLKQINQEEVNDG
ncbi:MAG TPA: MauE/DoxX family redox-associated membrane protein [Candidatus Kapabacteria bacterium]|nr:MauE/DoxX family redox-associated membrane protein [Candidatus Kapabacteria bacterium]